MRRAPAIGILALALSLALAAAALVTVMAQGVNTITTPDSTGTGPEEVNRDVGLWTSLKLDASGNPRRKLQGSGGIRTRRDRATRFLKILHCNDPHCVGGDESITSHDTTRDVGLFTSLELDASGYPVVIYWDQTNGDLKLLHCNDPNCAGGDESITSPDTTGDVGRFTSLERDANGYPVVSYWDVTTGFLKILHCNDLDFTNEHLRPGQVTAHGRVLFRGALSLDIRGGRRTMRPRMVRIWSLRVQVSIPYRGGSLGEFGLCSGRILPQERSGISAEIPAPG